MSPESRKILSVRRTAEIIGLLQELQGATISELAEETELSPGSVHSHLSTLQEVDYVIQDEKEYKIGPQMLTFGEHIRNNSELFKSSKEEIEELARETGESAHLIIEHGGKIYALYERFGSNAVGTRLHDLKRETPLNHLHCTAAGKSILAYLPRTEAQAIVDETGLPANTDQTITDVETLFQELNDIHERGYAIADEEQIEDIRAVGAPILDAEEDVVGAVALSGPTARLNGIRLHEELPELVTRTATLCEINYRAANADQEKL